MKKFISGFLVCALLALSITSVFGFSVKKVNVDLKKIQLIVDDIDLERKQEALIYKNDIYISLKEISEVFDKDIDFDLENNKAIITSRIHDVNFARQEISGKVTELEKQENDLYITVEEENGSIFFIEVYKDSEIYFINTKSKDIKVGDKIKIYQNMNAPIRAIYPPIYTPDAILIEKENEVINVNIDKFNDDLISSNGDLKLNINKETKIFNLDGSKFNGEIENRELIIIYSMLMPSMPAIVSPEKIIVLPFDK